MIKSQDNTVIVQGQLSVEELHRLLAAVHNLVMKQAYQNIVLDFSLCTAAFPGPMLAICSQISKLRNDGIDSTLILPKKDQLNRLFKNTNWAYFIDPDNYEISKFKGLRQVPATNFTDFNEQSDAVDNILRIILGSLSEFNRSDLAAIEWALNEITDNVINHSNSKVGGLVQVSTFKRTSRKVEFVVCDAGDGIPKTLRNSKPELTSDSDALDQAIREGVTKDKKTNQGNGLFGAFQISRVSEGSLEIHSGHGSLTYNKKQGLKIRSENVPFNGTLIICRIDYSKPDLLGKALKFGGQPHYPVDFIEMRLESSEGQKIIFKMKDEAISFGSRKAAEPINLKLKNLVKLCPGYKVFIDFTDIAVISSSFADEVFGKLFAEMGPLSFLQKFEFMNTSDTVKSLIDRAILLRNN